ncbi:tRNA pseudouridine(38-40) synthase TruA [Ruminiclostridium papyrosolvens]|uniref:tRNA pseudouridine synthase A n=1 Tax=Ruminiclostridium papyrosolvens C7 TaxID=1330534 RepID=U4QYI5_9FIRM|nr:tRNA pseudouridine(38-40) synthase TruA [Ruminiclostridium papyrosolvens]EPR09978.1 tRNA pseudouridine synthase A [Ruminiclostridium papyrosolvens C7]
MKNFKIIVQFDGSRYKGWQKLKDNNLSIQEKIETVLSKMTGEEIQVIGCGRTDAGTHAENYVANFHTNSNRSAKLISNYLYEFLPEDIVVKSVEEVPERFHAQHNVKSKTYVYSITKGRLRNVFNRKYSFHSLEKIDLIQMRNAAEYLVGTHDFQSFTSLKEGSKSTIRTINSLDIIENGMVIEIVINCNDFLLHMARLIVGILLEVGKGKVQATEVQNILNGKKFTQAVPFAQPKGLCLRDVQY